MLGRPSRRLWIAALAVSLACVGGLGYGVVMYGDTPPARPPLPSQVQVARGSGPTGGGFTLGLVLGIGGGIVIGSLLALRRPRS